MSALAPDSELTELEHRLLDAHIARCSECFAFAAGVKAVTAALRSAEHVQLSRPIRVPLRQRRPLVHVPLVHVRNVAATAAVALTALGLGSHGPLLVSEPLPASRDAAPRAISAVDTQMEIDEMRQVRRQELIAAGNGSIPFVRNLGTQPD